MAQILPTCKRFHWAKHIMYEQYSPPPTRHITFFVVASPPVRPERVNVVSRHVTTLRLSAFENAYCALISSPSLGTCALRSGGSTRSTRSPCAMEFTTAATSTSSGSKLLPGMYSWSGSWSIDGVYAPAREPGRDGARLPGPSRKLDGGIFFARPDEGWNTGTCCARARSACSGV